MKNKVKLFLSSVLPFGKYKGKTMYDIIKEDVQYLDWFHTNVNDNWDIKVKLMFNEFWERKNHVKYGFRNDKKKK